ncbi:MAG TPA: hypothetical protein VGJ60_31320 [Chloroflexota bacterium]|jgi:hypothetical protein
MISEQTALPGATRIVTSHTSATPVGRRHLTVLGGVLRRAAINLSNWARVPALPYAALWEASVVAGTLHEPKDFEPDPFATETGFLKDSWPRG